MIKYKINEFSFVRTVLSSMTSSKINIVLFNSSDYSYIASYEDDVKFKQYKKVEIFAFLFIYERTPNVVLEAPSFKLSLIISRGTGGALDFIKHKKVWSYS